MNLFFFEQLQGEKEGCVTALLLICSEHHRGSDVAMWAAQAFLLYGGEPTTAADQQMAMRGPCGPNVMNLQQGVPGTNMGSPSIHSGSALDTCGRTISPIYMSTPLPHSAGAASSLRSPQQHSYYGQQNPHHSQHTIPSPGKKLHYIILIVVLI